MEPAAPGAVRGRGPEPRGPPEGRCVARPPGTPSPLTYVPQSKTSGTRRTTRLIAWPRKAQPPSRTGPFDELMSPNGNRTFSFVLIVLILS